MAVEVVSNFLKYVDRHDVCLEYADDVKNAQKICDRALKEIPAIYKLIKLLPGALNKAARAFFCKDGNKESYEFDNGFDNDFSNLGCSLDKNTARTLLGVGLAILLGREHSKKIAELMDNKDLFVIDTAERSLEVCEVSLPDDQIRAQYHKISGHLGGGLAGGLVIEPCGSLSVRTAVIETGWEMPTLEKALVASERMDTLFLEESILKLLEVGMKLRVTVCTLNTGFKFIKSINDIYPTFHTFLPQELMVHFKEPVGNERPGPSICGPEADEDILDQIPIGDLEMDA